MSVRLPEGTFTVGAGAGCDLVVADPYLGRHRVVFERAGDQLRFRDEGRTGGVLLNEEPSLGAWVKIGDRITVGMTVFGIEREPPAVPSPDGAAEAAAPGTDERSFQAVIEALAGSEDPSELLARLLTTLSGLFLAERGFVLLREASGGKPVIVASHALKDADEFVAVSKTVYGRALATGVVVYIQDTSADEGCRQSSTFLLAQGRSVLCAPLQAGGERYGVVYLDMPCLDRPLAPTQLHLFEALAAVAATRLAAVRIRRSLVDARRQLEAMDQLAWESERLVLGEGPQSRELGGLIEAAAGRDTNVLVSGETGTGKEMVARALHRRSARRSGPFVPVNCAALPRDLMEAELFGAERGAFTGASEQRKGRFELASGGTLFLDEVGDLPVEVQVKLLRVLEERTVTRVGGSRPVPVDFRLVCATNRDLEAAVRDGAFRSDFYFRINVFRIHLKPLRERPEDLRPLIAHFLQTFSTRFGKAVLTVGSDALRTLLGHRWPGNIRELKNALERAVLVEGGAELTPASLSFLGGPGVGPGVGPADAPLGLPPDLPPDFSAAQDLFERSFLERALRRAGGNIAAVVRESGLGRPTVYRWLDRFGMKPRDS